MTLTGIAQAAGALGLLYPPTASPAAVGLAFLLLAMFPALSGPVRGPASANGPRRRW